MKEILTAVAALAVALFMWKKEKISVREMVLALLLAVVGLAYCLLSGFSGKGAPITSVERGKTGSSDKRMEFQVQAGDSDSYITLDIPAVRLSEEEAKAELKRFCLRLDQEILGKNGSLEEVAYPLLLQESYGDSSVQVQWQTDTPAYVNWRGELGPEIPEEGADVLLRADLFLDGERECYQRQIRVFPSKEPVDLPGRIQAEAERVNQAGSESVFELPESVGSMHLTWYQVQDSRGWLVIGLALVLLGVMPLVHQQKRREGQQKRAEELDLEYPDLVSRMQMLLGAGLGMRSVIEKIAREGRTDAVHEEMLTCCRELENGVSETEVYRRFGERCGTPSYRGLSLLLEQNKTKGGQGLIPLLEQEAMEAFESRQRRARQQGEKVSVRLLLPMGMMLLIVLALIMIPAFMSI